MTHSVGLDVSQKTTSVWIVDDAGRRIWRGIGCSEPDAIAEVLRRHGGPAVQVGIETGPMAPRLVQSLRMGPVNETQLEAAQAPQDQLQPAVLSFPRRNEDEIANM